MQLGYVSWTKTAKNKDIFFLFMSACFLFPSKTAVESGACLSLSLQALETFGKHKIKAPYSPLKPTALN